MSSLQNIEDFIACQRQQNMRKTTLNVYFCDKNANLSHVWILASFFISKIFQDPMRLAIRRIYLYSLL